MTQPENDTQTTDTDGPYGIAAEDQPTHVEMEKRIEALRNGDDAPANLPEKQGDGRAEYEK